MRALYSNLSPVFFRCKEYDLEIMDQYGNLLGTYLPVYGAVQSAMLCVSPNKGNSEVQGFGIDLDYSRTMTSADPNCAIDENTVLWIDGADTDGAWNYEVKAVAKWKNSSNYAIQKVEVSAYQDYEKTLEEQLALHKQYGGDDAED